jgi:hypothetical protein
MGEVLDMAGMKVPTAADAPDDPETMTPGDLFMLRMGMLLDMAQEIGTLATEAEEALEALLQSQCPECSQGHSE